LSGRWFGNITPVSISAPSASEISRATELARERLERSKTAVKRMFAGTVIVVLVAVVWLGLETASAARLQASGIRASARIDGVYDGKGGAGITVSYPSSNVYVSIPLWFSTGSYRVGGRVQIVYDSSDHSHAVVGTGLPAPGGLEGLPFLLLIGGATVVAILIYALRRTRGSDPSVLVPPRAMSISSTGIESSDDVDLALLVNEEAVASMGTAPGKDWPARHAPQQVLVFGVPTPNSTIIAVDLEHERTLLRQLREPKVVPADADE
jgi:hypothetical protein